ncbi:phasin family protein (plasmid) [Burkholderia thailandensis]|uniref:phasin family protein n=1 Tax=Burkholderia thailandensis TaxID=57975 RepID=UPI00192D86BC|nr:phasin family protein [Burkholderia thailandensis]MBS2132304.1 phasin family protein [Burkholderia thailandensis]QRA15114.1 phasin family protein [Burkholderia thailandensis]
MLTQEQAVAFQKANLDNLFGLTGKIVEGIGKVAALNMQVIRSTMTGSFDEAQKALSMKEPSEWLVLQNSLTGPTAEKLQAYGRQLLEIMSATQAECAPFMQAQWDEYGRRAHTLVVDAAKTAPAGSEATFAALNSAITATNALYETLQKTGETAVEVTKSNLDAAAAAASKSARRTSEPVSQAAKR